jgi:hypothetical protein
MKVLALAGMLALGSLTIATAASARGGGGGGGMGHGGGMAMGHTGGMSMGHAGGMSMGHWSGGTGHWNGGMGRWGGTGWHGHVGHFRPFFFHNHRRFFAFGFGSYYGYPDYDYGYDDCWRPTHVLTRWGWRWRTVNVCGYY